MAFSKMKDWKPEATDIPISEEIKHTFAERAAICEFDGDQPKIEAEIGALNEVMPFLELINGQERLVVDTTKSPLKYRYWQGGQSLEATLREIGASEETISRYISQLEGRAFL